MTRQIQVNEPIASHRRLYFHLVATDGITAALGEAGGQPQVSVNGAAWTNTGIGTLTAVGSGRYYADLSVLLLTTVGDVIETRYKSSNTAECPGDTAEVVEFTEASLNFTASSQTQTPVVTAQKSRGFTKDIVLFNVDGDPVVALTNDKLRAYIGHEGDLNDDLSGAVFLITTDTDSAAGSYFRKNSPSSGANRLRIDATDLSFDPGIYTLFVDFYDSNDANEWKTASRDVFILENS